MTTGTEPLPLWRRKIDVERVKIEGLDPDLERLERDGYNSLTPEEFYRLKTFGVCSQRTPGLHMIRIRIPGGRITAAQLRGIRDLAVESADGGAHITTRQNLELHTVQSSSVRRVLAGIEAVGLTTRSACGHTVRNVIGCTLTGICADEAFDIAPTVQALHDFFLSNASTYNARLPRRINVSVAGCSGCMSHAQVNDLGFVAVRLGGKNGFQLWCAGSLASNPRLAHLLFGFVPEDEAVPIAQAVADVYCEHGFRERSAKARMKFLLEEWGADRFADAVMERLRELLPDARTRRAGALPVYGPDRRRPGNHNGIFPQKQDGYVRVEARVPLGDLSAEQMSMLADIADECEGVVWLTREQNAELHWIPNEMAGDVAEAMRSVGLLPEGAGSLVDVQVCAGSDYCIWGVGDSRGMARELESELASLVASDAAAEPMRVHISGCSHGCAQHQVADVGLSAIAVRDGDRGTCEGFELYGGGRLGVDPRAGKRLGKVPAYVTQSRIVGLVSRFVAERHADETFANFLTRTGASATVALEPEVTSE
jgi:sulfite reductase beta subunit-like hemoprotein